MKECVLTSYLFAWRYHRKACTYVVSILHEWQQYAFPGFLHVRPKNNRAYNSNVSNFMSIINMLFHSYCICCRKIVEFTFMWFSYLMNGIDMRFSPTCICIGKNRDFTLVWFKPFMSNIDMSFQVMRF